jgi:DNA segregation ATPase FtsK/SpoIIIE, S-DNA-T family
MARSSVDLGKSPFMPPALAAFLRRRSLEAVGLLLLLIGAALLLALATYSSLDPSANRAATGAVHNWLGSHGAWTADWLLQMMGIAAIVPAVVFAAWGWHLVAKRNVGPAWLKLALLPPALLLIAAACAALPAPDSWR